MKKKKQCVSLGRSLEWVCSEAYSCCAHMCVDIVSDSFYGTWSNPAGYSVNLTEVCACNTAQALLIASLPCCIISIAVFWGGCIQSLTVDCLDYFPFFEVTYIHACIYVCLWLWLWWWWWWFIFTSITSSLAFKYILNFILPLRLILHGCFYNQSGCIFSLLHRVWFWKESFDSRSTLHGSWSLSSSPVKRKSRVLV